MYYSVMNTDRSSFVRAGVRSLSQNFNGLYFESWKEASYVYLLLRMFISLSEGATQSV